MSHFLKKKEAHLFFREISAKDPPPPYEGRGRPYRPKTRIQRRVSKDTHPTAGAVPRAGPKEMFDRLLWHADYAETQIHSVSAESARSVWEMCGVLARRIRRFFLYLRSLRDRRGKCVLFLARRLRRLLLYLRNLRDRRGKCVAFWHADYADCSVSAESARSAWRIAKTPVTVTY